MINCPKEFESHVSSTFCVMHVLKLKQFPRMYELIYFLVLLQARNFAVVEIQFLLESYTQRAKHFSNC